MGQLQYWNPDLLSDCSNLQLGDAYCVNGADQPPAGNTEVATSSGPSMKAKLKRGTAFVPERTKAPEGGVPYGWPGLNAPRFQRGLGAAKQEL